MKVLQKPFLIIMLLAIASFALAASGDWCGTFSIRGGRTDPSCDIESPGKTLFMFGTSFDLWYKDIVSIGPSVFFTQLHSGPIGASLYSGTWEYPEYANFRAYIAAVDLKARFRPKWDWINIQFPDHFIDRIAPYIEGGAGIITFDPQDREGTVIDSIWYYGTYISNNYTKHAGMFPVIGGGITLFSRLGVTGDIGIEYHKVNSDYLDGVKDGGDKDSFWSYYIGLTLLNTCKPEAPPVVLPPEPEPEPEIEIEFEPELVVTPPVQNVPHQAGTTSYDVKANVTWFAAENCDWFTLSPAVGTNDGQFTVSYAANPNRTPRTCDITVSGGGLTRTVQIVQAPAPEPKFEFKKDVALIIEGVNFKTDKADLTEGAQLILDEVVTTLKEFPEVTLDIQGHTDSDASDAYNIDLSRRRAISVKTYLVEHGIDANRLTTSWYGERRPLVPNTTPANKAKNRRIEFIRTDD